MNQQHLRDPLCMEHQPHQIQVLGQSNEVVGDHASILFRLRQAQMQRLQKVDRKLGVSHVGGARRNVTRRSRSVSTGRDVQRRVLIKASYRFELPKECGRL
jgi:hypothetical protein